MRRLRARNEAVRSKTNSQLLIRQNCVHWTEQTFRENA